MSFGLSLAKSVMNRGLCGMMRQLSVRQQPTLIAQHRLLTAGVVERSRPLGGAVEPLSPLVLGSRSLHTTVTNNLQQSENWVRNIDRRLMVNEGKFSRKKKKPSKMFNKPQIRGVVIKLLIKKPKKPNSANRRCCKVRLTNKKVIIAHIPGEGHTLQEHNMVMIRGGRVSDLANVHHKVIRGKLDCAPVVKKSAR